MKTTILGSTLVVGLLAALGTIGCANGELAADTAAACAREEQSNILDLVAKTSSFSVLARAIDAADLTETLKGEGPFTVFAPTDEAFSKLPEGVLEQLLLPENKGQLRDLLLGHVAAGRMNESQIRTMSAVATLGGEEIPIEATPDGIMIGASMVMGQEIDASNGVIHVVDAVILPEEPGAPPQETIGSPQEPVNPQEPVMPQEPGAQQEPVNPQEPGAQQEPVNPQEPGAQQEPANPQEPVMPQEPGAQQAPVMIPEEPGIAAQEPGAIPTPPVTPHEHGVGCPSSNP